MPLMGEPEANFPCIMHNHQSNSLPTGSPAGSTLAPPTTVSMYWREMKAAMCCPGRKVS